MDMKIAPRRRAGLGQGFHEPKLAETPAVRLRTGNQAGRGELIRDGNGRSTAFVWSGDPAPVPSREILIQARLAGGWLWERNEARVLQQAFSGDREFQRSLARLQDQFEDWHRLLVKYYNPTTPFRFDWGRFNEQGLRLARRLQAVIIDDAVVRYRRAEQDRQYRVSPEMAV